MRKIFLDTYDNKSVELPPEYIDLLPTVKDFVETFSGTDDLHQPMPPVHEGLLTANLLELVFEFCALDLETEKHPATIPPPFIDHLATKDREEIFQMILAANFFNYENLLNATCMTVAKKIRNIPNEDLPSFFGANANKCE